jgi:hypothetical protein
LRSCPVYPDKVTMLVEMHYSNIHVIRSVLGIPKTPSGAPVNETIATDYSRNTPANRKVNYKKVGETNVFGRS